MPIKIPNALPAREILEHENIFTMNENRAQHQDIRPLRIVILNLMPTKVVTETQLFRLLSNTPIQIDITLLKMNTHISKNTPSSHLDSFYKSFDDIKNEKFDGMIITGAPVENLEFEQVDYWDELCDMMRWSKKNVHSTMYICWGAQAGLYFNYGINKYPAEKKVFGVFEHALVNPSHDLVKGFDEVFLAPHSRHSFVSAEDILNCPKVELLSYSDKAGVFLVASKSRRNVFITGHVEYDYDTLMKEYFRDRDKGLDIEMPYNYFPDDDPAKRPLNRWRSHAHLLFANWLNYFVYQETPYDLAQIVQEQ
ncbi:Homoserine O-acetyltransferase 1 [bioreactor metagenome]|uniref:Homoserine O-acetyltransferase 1 n=1 Tax=bioreactor metagenome TaxID=1076179 RepID=A0A645BA52_9ZZZZ|nr:homoserine O-succinyltransferase [Oscillospiraceae bacterium]